MTVFEDALLAAQQGTGFRRRQAYEGAFEALELTGLATARLPPLSLATSAGGAAVTAERGLEVARPRDPPFDYPADRSARLRAPKRRL
jgi:hypothetical protein